MSATRRTLTASVALTLVMAVSIRSVRAMQNGIVAAGCNGCHSGTAQPTVNVTASPLALSPGQLATLTVTISGTNPVVGGFYIEAGGKGTFSVLPGEGTKLNGMGVTQSTPKRASGGVVTFTVSWTAPASPGGVNFNVYGLAANGDGTSRGDSPGYGFLSIAYGCSGMVYYRDFDADGYGALANGYTRDCSMPANYALALGDCDDNDPRVHPGATEICNHRDDNCNGLIDDGLPTSTYYPDADGDGYGTKNGPTKVDCGPSPGFGATSDDCNDSDPAIHPGAQEICNYKDDNCNGLIDEGAREECGTGWCRRLGSGCGTNDCVPGKPRSEICNDFDDDCDGVIDNGTNLCGSTMKCVSGYCIGPDGGISADGSPLAFPPTVAASAGLGCDVGRESGRGSIPIALAAALMLTLVRRR